MKLGKEGVDVYQFGDHEYAAVQYEYGGYSLPNVQRNYVSSFVWAASPAAVHGLLLRNPGSEEVPRLYPPDELLLKPECAHFHEVFRLAKSGEFGPLFTTETGLSVSVLEKAFLIAVGRFDYFFSAGLEDWTGETPILIRWHTSDKRWMKLGCVPFEV